MHNRSLSQMSGFRILFLATCANLVVYFYWMQLPYTSVTAAELHSTGFKHLSRKNINYFSYSNVDQRIKRSTDSVQESTNATDLKYILFWTKYDMAPFHYFLEGQRSFINNKCPNKNCYVTTNKTFFNDVSKFDAIAFNGRLMSLTNMPKKRSRLQKYIYVQMEPANYFPICDKRYDGFFNWTSTYRLDSDIPYPYFVVKNKQGDVIGPQTNMQWSQNFPEVDNEMAARLANKTKAAAWFVSRCNSKSRREVFVRDMQRALQRYGLDVDIYGKCGPKKCERREWRRCDAILNDKYYFYLSFENSLCEDYVTEKLQNGVQNYIVPIVLGGANYSRFLPPGSYIDSKSYNATSLAAYMHQLMQNPAMYREFFRWKSEYAYSTSTRIENVCAVCAALSNKEKFEAESVYTDFRKWWLPNYKTMCTK